MHELTRIIIDLFILLMLFWMIFYDSEVSNPIKKWWIPKIQPVFYWLGLSHEWKMFSPEPYKQNMWPKLKIRLKNGEFIIWEPTRPSQLNAFEKIKYKKYYKIYHEVSRAKTSYHIKTDFIEHLLHKHQLYDCCEKVEVYRVHTVIKKYGQEVIDHTTYQRLVYTYTPIR